MLALEQIEQNENKKTFEEKNFQKNIPDFEKCNCTNHLAVLGSLEAEERVLLAEQVDLLKIQEELTEKIKEKIKKKEARISELKQKKSELQKNCEEIAHELGYHIVPIQSRQVYASRFQKWLIKTKYRVKNFRSGANDLYYEHSG